MREDTQVVASSKTTSASLDGELVVLDLERGIYDGENGLAEVIRAEAT